MRQDSDPLFGQSYFRDLRGDIVFDYVRGDGPVVLCAPHAGWKTMVPLGATLFGSRKRDSSDPTKPKILGQDLGLGGFNDAGGDYGTRYIVMGAARELIKLGVAPSVIINRIPRYYADPNRPWGQHHHWESPTTPSHLTNPDGMDPAFRWSYYEAFHHELSQLVERASRIGGWLFDVHGEGGETPPSMRIATHRGITAQATAVYDGNHSFVSMLREQDLTPTPLRVEAEASGYSYISGFLHGVTSPSQLAENQRPAEPSYPRLNAVQIEIAGGYRNPPNTQGYEYMNNIEREHIDWLEGIGAKLGRAIHGFLRGLRRV